MHAKSCFAVLIGIVCVVSFAYSEDVPARTSMRDWVGRKFVILPQPTDQQRYGYSCLRRSEGGYIIPNYAEVAGKIATVTKVEIPAYGDRRIHLTLDENGKEFVAVTKEEFVSCLAPAADLDSARAKWLGKTLWVRRTKFLKTSFGKSLAADEKIQNYSPVTVKDVQPGFDYNTPVRFSLDAQGKEVFADIRASEVNIAEHPTGSTFDEVFLTEDPRITHAWGDKIWNSVANAEVETGMTLEQVQMSWGDPSAVVDVTSEHCNCHEWEYGNTTLYFRDGKLERAEDK